MQLEDAMLIVSIDVDVGSKEIGLINRAEKDNNAHRHLSEYLVGEVCPMSEYLVGEIEERALPLFIDFFNDLEIPVTFAIRGQLAEVNNPILELLRNSPIKHDIGSHGYYHRVFTSLSKTDADSELNMISVGMKKLGITPRSFVFPKNRVAHLSILEKYGYKCYRGYGGFRNDGMYIEKRGQLYDIHPSFFLGQSVSPIFLDRMINISIKNKVPFHVWFHPWEFGRTKGSIKKSIEKVFYPVFKYAKEKQKNGFLTFETMLSATRKIETTFV